MNVEFPHLTVQYELLERNISFNFNSNQCQNAGLKEIPNNDNYELIKIRRIYHFNKGTTDHIILTVEEPYYLLIYKGIDLNNSFLSINSQSFTETNDNIHKNFKVNSKDKAEVIIKCISDAAPEKVKSSVDSKTVDNGDRFIRNNGICHSEESSLNKDVSCESRVIWNNKVFQSGVSSFPNSDACNESASLISFFEKDTEDKNLKTYTKETNELVTFDEYNINEIIIDDTCHNLNIPLEENIKTVNKIVPEHTNRQLRDTENPIIKEHSYSVDLIEPLITVFPDNYISMEVIGNGKNCRETFNKLDTKTEKCPSMIQPTRIIEPAEHVVAQNSINEKEIVTNINFNIDNKIDSCDNKQQSELLLKVNENTTKTLLDLSQDSKNLNCQIKIEKNVNTTDEEFVTTCLVNKENMVSGCIIKQDNLPVQKDGTCTEAILNSYREDMLDNLKDEKDMERNAPSVDINVDIEKNIKEYIIPNSYNSTDDFGIFNCEKQNDLLMQEWKWYVGFNLNFQHKRSASIKVNLSDQDSSIEEPPLKQLKIDNYDFMGFTKEEQQNKTVANMLEIYDKQINFLCEEIENNTDVKTKINKKKVSLYECSRCTFKVQKLSHLQLHLRSHVEPFWCNLCLGMYSTSGELYNHVRNNHTNIGKKPTKQCTTGKKPFKNSNRIEKDIFKCGFCNYSSSRVRHLKHHTKIHQKEKLYYCDECNFTTLTEWIMESHMNKHENEQYECIECGFISLYKTELNLHTQIHNKEKKFKCQQCTFSTSHLGYFNAHSSFHWSKTKFELETKTIKKIKKSYKCNKCNYTTKLRPLLYKHEKSIHEDNKFIKNLSICNDKDKLQLCMKCDFWAETKEEHSFAYEDAEIYRCNLCNFTSHNESDFKIHNTEHLENNNLSNVKYVISRS